MGQENMRTRARLPVITGAAVLATIAGLHLLSPPSAEAIPAWARRYDVDCSSCHVGGGWKLNRMGQDFLRYGHRFEGDSTKDTGFGDYNSFGYKFRFNGGNKKIESFEQHAFSIYTGGPLGGGFSYFAELYLHENSGKNNFMW